MTGIQQFDSVLDGLLRARSILSDERRWLRGHLEANGLVCLTGAVKLGTACDMGHWTELAIQTVEHLELELALSPWRSRSPVRYCCVPDFNDHPDTTHADVLALIDAAVEKRAAMLACAC